MATSESAGIFSVEFSGSIDLVDDEKTLEKLVSKCLERKTAIIQRIQEGERLGWLIVVLNSFLKPSISRRNFGIWLAEPRVGRLLQWMIWITTVDGSQNPLPVDNREF